MLACPQVCKYCLLHDLTYLRHIGVGGFATIELVRSEKYQKEFVLKVAKTPTSVDVNQEIEAIMKLSHPNIIRMYQVFKEDGYYCLLLEYCPGGSLKDYIVRNGAFPVRSLLGYLKQIFQAIQCAHENLIAHRDIKPANILIDSHNRAVVTDFGLAMQMEHGAKTTSTAGSRCYMAPELFFHSEYDPFAADIWSLGVMAYEMMYGKLPWPSIQEQHLETAITLGCIQFSIANPCVQMVKQMLSVLPEKRPKIGDLVIMIDHLILSDISKHPIKPRHAAGRVACSRSHPAAHLALNRDLSSTNTVRSQHPLFSVHTSSSAHFTFSQNGNSE